MHSTLFHGLTASLARRGSRRRLARFLALVLGLGTATGRRVDAKKRRKKLRRNAFGCVNVGGRCRGKDAVCCSGICRGKRPKQGKRDRSRCVAHDAGDCAVGQDSCGPPGVPCLTSAGANGFCSTTTGNAAYCWDDGECAACSRDSDCHEQWGPSAACLRCASCPQGTSCGTPI
jgi:hypothetical protein